MNVCTKFQGNRSSSCWDICLKNTNVSFIIWGPLMLNFAPIHQIVVEIFPLLLITALIALKQAAVFYSIILNVHQLQHANIPFIPLCTPSSSAPPLPAILLGMLHEDKTLVRYWLLHNTEQKPPSLHSCDRFRLTGCTIHSQGERSRTEGGREHSGV